MYPTLFQIGPFTLHAYGFMLALSFFLGVLLASRRAPGRGFSPDLVFDLSLVIVFASIVGARALYVLFHRDEIDGFLDMVAVWSGGLTMYGGVLAAMAASWVYLRRRRIPFLRMADVVAPSLGLGLMLTRIGCFLNGCCYGEPTSGPFGVHFPPDSAVGRMFDGLALHPAQIYSSATGLAILLGLLAFDRRRRPTGQVFALFLVLDATGRFLLDFVRFYEANVYILWQLTVNQIISLGLFALGVLLWFRSRARAVDEANGKTAGPEPVLSETP